MSLPLSNFQDTFAAALFERGAHPHTGDDAWMATLQAQPGFAVYRNTVFKACIDALQANFPTVHQWVGDEWFRAAAAVFAHTHPPTDGLLMNYGQPFAEFLARFGPAEALPCLPALAHLDRCWTECHLGANATALDAAWLARQPAQALATVTLKPHPAARWAWCDDHPAYVLWQAHRNNTLSPDTPPWVGDGGLLTRPRDAVTWRPISRAGVAFLDACAAGLPLEAAATAALTAEPTADFAALMALLLDAGALTTHDTHTHTHSHDRYGHPDLTGESP